MILLTPLVVLAFQAQAEQVRKADIKSKSFTAGPLKITFLSFGRGNFGITGDPHTDTRYNHPIRAKVENASDEFTTFTPQRLSFVDKANDQLDRPLAGSRRRGQGFNRRQTVSL